MSSLRNAISRRAHKERAQPSSRKKFGLLEKHKDYVVRAKAFHKKEETLRAMLTISSFFLCSFCRFALQKLKEKAAFRNPDEFYFQMIKTRTVDGVHKPESQANKYTQEELMLMKTQDIGYILQKLQSERKKIEKLTAVLHSVDNHPSNRHIYYAEDRFDFLISYKKYVFIYILLYREEARELQSQASQSRVTPTSGDIPDLIKRKTAASYRELEARKNRVNQLEKLYMEMSLKKELQKKGRKRKLREDELVCPTSKPVYKWRSERKR
ncbi:putative U3 small nucleolar RNA-associated protein 11 isoform X2 [Gossypium australe]|uniref:U3 small nucleolar RNA-associated protein 11 n=1 Tax=Gossypium australe TaxID=47621 RepID=A0A5B6WL83_9ROSI|nr:putative U3 small nucleolar RNA-associated protein 11 isoform X2 [Gossypium australe]